MIVFFGTSPRSARFLEQAIKNSLKVDLVVSSPPQPLGRRQILTENPTVTVAKNHNIPFLLNIFNLLESVIPSPANGGVEESLSLVRGKGIPPLSRHGGIGRDDVGIILDFNQIIPPNIINLFDRGIINIHFSKLPQYRGPAPVQYTILKGEKEAWTTYFLINERVDEGLVLSQTSLPLNGNETTAILYHKLLEKASQDITKIVKDYLDDHIKPQPQIGNTTFSYKLSVENTKIDWSKPAVEIDRLIRAAFPEPIAWTSALIRSQSAKIQTERRLKILKAHLENSQLVLDQVQLEGKNPVSWKQFKEGYPEAEIIK